MMIGNGEKLAAIEREIAYRRRLYPRWVDAGKMKFDRAEREIEVMEAIAEDYRRLLAGERLL